VSNDGNDPAGSPWRPSRVAAALLYVGTVNAVSVLAFMALGWGIDALAGTTPLFILIGLPLGILGGVVATIRVVRDYLGQ